jgi:hypothetical protein
VDGARWIGTVGRRSLGDYDVGILHGFLRGEPGTDECATIALRGACPPEALDLSAQLLQEA